MGDEVAGGVVDRGEGHPYSPAALSAVAPSRAYRRASMWASRPGQGDWSLFVEFVRSVFRLAEDGTIVFREREAEDFPLVADAPDRAATLWNVAWGGRPVPVRGGKFLWCEVDKVAMPWTAVRHALGVLLPEDDRNPRWAKDRNVRRGMIEAMSLREVCGWYGLDIALQEYRVRSRWEGEGKSPTSRRVARAARTSAARVPWAWESRARQIWEGEWLPFDRIEQCFDEWKGLNDYMVEGYQRDLEGEVDTTPFAEWVRAWCTRRRIALRRREV